MGANSGQRVNVNDRQLIENIIDLSSRAHWLAALRYSQRPTFTVRVNIIHVSLNFHGAFKGKSWLRFAEYYEVVTESLRRHSEQCVDDIKAAFDAVEELLAAEHGPEKLKSYFK